MLLFVANRVARFLKAALTFIHSKKPLAVVFYGLLLFVFCMVVVIKTAGDSEFNKTLTNRHINDITRLNSIQVDSIMQPRTVEEIAEAIKTSTGPISIGGGKFSMGGQTAFEHSLHFDMTQFNKIISLDTVSKQITVQPGIRWRDIQRAIDPYNLSVKIMQTYADFTVGGAISVNCHGRYIGHGPVISSVQQIKLVLASGEVVTANRETNSDLFNAAIGGYGGIGVIVEATLQLADNVKVQRKCEIVKAEDYYTYFNRQIRDSANVIFQNGDLYPPHYDEINSISWSVTNNPVTDTARINLGDGRYWLESKLVKIVSWGRFGKWFRKCLVDPFYYSQHKVLWRNYEASYDVRQLEPINSGDKTYVLQEYFIPVQNINSFTPKMRDIFNRYRVNVVNVSLRHALPDTESYLSWAPREVFAYVIYYQQGTDAKAKEKVKQWTQEMTDAVISEQGTWYLPYQPHATVAQFEKGYPNADKYFEVKKRVDPNHRFTNKLLDKYNPGMRGSIEHERNNIKGYFRPEEQTLLTVPEWYLVFNPKEYADYLESGKNPSAFPFYASVNEYWKLYDRSLKLTSKAYPENKEYKTMLKIIGVSVTVEYCIKSLYENTVGRFFNLFATKNISSQEKIIIQAQRAYSDVIYHQPWYEFKFLPWVKKVWAVSDTSGGGFLRKWERTLFFTLEFSFKAFYSRVIEWGAKHSYEPPVTDIYVLASLQDSVAQTAHLKIVKQQGDRKILAIGRWDVFNETIPQLADKQIAIEEIGGNHTITVSVIVNQGQAIVFPGTELLYTSAIVTNSSIQRQLYLLPVSQLLPFIHHCKDTKTTVEHIYDY
ncbi:MAG TPA: FAD-dependent oxidoreductase [Chitinophagales bacterium]|nr:FAD-dependent oxidoreductase [Chitinophagales bacterium]